MSATVTRSVPFDLIRAEQDGDGLTMCGYAAVFNTPTRIRGEGPQDFDEIMAPGSFARTIKARTPVLMFDHGQHPLIGSMPLGQITTLREDPRGLYVEARLHNNWLTEPVRDAIASQAVSGMSFRFSVPKDKETWDRSGPVPLRTVREVNCPELGPVVFPAYADTSVGVRSLMEKLDINGRQEFLDSVRAVVTDADEVEQPSLVAQVKSLVAALLMDEASELADDPDATGALYALLSVLSDLTWFESIDAVEDQQMDDDSVSEQMNSETPDAPRIVWSPHVIDTHAEPAESTSGRDSSVEADPPCTPQPISRQAAELWLLKHRSVA